MDSEEEGSLDEGIEELYKKGLLVQKHELSEILTKSTHRLPEALCQKDGTSILRTGRVQQRRALILLPAYVQFPATRGNVNKLEDESAILGKISGLETQRPVLRLVRKGVGEVRLHGHKLRPRNVFVTLKSMSNLHKGKFLRVDDTMEEVIIFAELETCLQEEPESNDMSPLAMQFHKVECSNVVVEMSENRISSGGVRTSPHEVPKIMNENPGKRCDCPLPPIGKHDSSRSALMPVGGFTGHLSESERQGLTDSALHIYEKVERAFSSSIPLESHGKLSDHVEKYPS
ncbi:hypothetical protein CCYA_CCYA12G3387 [Cyanidiococcus yangmingshanensis]|nr:hypothetical protein CCYA_CCYA12G3387 [Cyanidiococcus yangmingshanensis]